MDNLTHRGATDLALKIAEHWRARGYPQVETIVVPVGKASDDGNVLFGVRSNLDHRGLPPLAGVPARIAA